MVLVTLVGSSSRPILRQLHLKPSGMLWRGWWEVPGLCLAVDLLILEFHARNGFSPPGSAGRALSAGLEMHSPYQGDVCPAIICLRSFMGYHITRYQSMPPSSFLELRWAEGGN